MKLSVFDYICIAIVALLLLCLAPMPYGYYTIVRIAVMCLAIYVGVISFKENKTGLAIICGGVAVLFQPFIKFVLGKDVWHIMDVLVAIAIVAYVIYKHKN